MGQPLRRSSLRGTWQSRTSRFPSPAIQSGCAKTSLRLTSLSAGTSWTLSPRWIRPPGSAPTLPRLRSARCSVTAPASMEAGAVLAGSAVDPFAAAAGELEHFGFGGHGGVARGGHGQGAVRGAVLHGALEWLAGQQAVDQPGREPVATADAVQDLQPRAVGGLHDAGRGGPGDRTPVIDAGRSYGAHRGGDDLEVRVGGGRLGDHGGELVHLKGREVLAGALDLE